MKSIKNRFTGIVALSLAAVLTLGGCASKEPMPNNGEKTKQGALIGALAGAAVGAAVSKHHRGKGALIGAAAGGLLGGARPTTAVLLIDEIDRADEEFEAYLLEILSDFQITIPEIGTIAATTRPHVILTANGARDLSDALRRRCLYSYVDYPDRKTELAILAKRCPDLEERLAEQIVGFVQALRKEELEKNPGIAEVLDWAAALAGLGVNDLADNPEQTQATLVCLLKTERDRAAVPKEVQQRLVGKAA